MQRYKTFGFLINSAWELPLTSVSDDRAVDLTICAGQCPVSLSDAVQFSPCLQANRQEILLEVGGIATFHCIKNKITVSAQCQLTDAIQTFLLYAAIPYWLLLQDCLVLRGCALSFDNQNATLICSHSGGGSSTIGYLAAMKTKSAQLISDHLCVLRKDLQGRVVVYPGYKHIKLWQHQVEALNIPEQERVSLRKNVPLYLCKSTYSNRSFPISNIFFLFKCNEKKIAKGIKGFDKLDVYCAYAYYLSNSEVMNKIDGLSRLWLPVVKKASLSRLYIHRGFELPSETLKKIMQVQQQTEEVVCE
jgi:hypothetical protein